MKKALVVLFSLLLVFLMVPVLPNAVYAADVSARGTDVAITEAAQQFYQSLSFNSRLTRMSGLGGMTPADTKAGPKTFEDASRFVDAETLPTSGWIAIDADGDGYNWMDALPEVGGPPYMTSLTGSDSECVVSASYDNDTYTPLSPDNWLVSPAIELTGYKQLQYYVCGQDPNYYAEHYGVYVSTTSQTDTTTFTKLYEETVSSGSYEARTVDLTDYYGKTVYIAFRHFDVTDMFFLNLDGIALTDTGEVPPEPPVTDPTIIRIKGKNRYDTSIEIASKILEYAPEGTKYPYAIIATGDAFPDALAGSALSTAFSAPILLISPKSPSTIDNALAFIEENVNPEGYVFILGGKGAVPETLESQLDDIGMKAARFAGKNRYETNLVVLDVLYEVGSIRELIICDGTNWPDAATASAVGLPIMLVPKTGFTDDQWDFINNITDYDEETGTVGNKIFFDFIGGAGAVSEEIYDSVAAYELEETGSWRLAGKNRAETATKVASAYWDAEDVSSVTFAYAVNFPDCISGGLLAYLFEAPILYGDSSNPKTYVDADVPYLATTDAWSAFVLGGASLVSDEFIIDLFMATLELE